MAQAIMSGLTGKLWAIKNAKANAEDKVAMNAAGMATGSGGAADEPILNPEDASQSCPGNNAYSQAAENIVGAAGEAAATGIRVATEIGAAYAMSQMGGGHNNLM